MKGSIIIDKYLSSINTNHLSQMIKYLALAFLVCYVLGAPSTDKMTKVPVRLYLLRATPIPSSPSHPYTVDISPSAQASEKLTTSLSNPLKDPLIMTPSPSGSTEAQAALHFSVHSSLTQDSFKKSVHITWKTVPTTKSETISQPTRTHGTTFLTSCSSNHQPVLDTLTIWTLPSSTMMFKLPTTTSSPWSNFTRNSQNTAAEVFGLLVNLMRASTSPTWPLWSCKTTQPETAASSWKVFWSEMVSFHSIILKEAKLNSWSQEALLTLKLFNIGNPHAKLTPTQLVANSSSRDTDKTSENLILTVFCFLIPDVYGYCYYNDSMASNKTKRYETQYTILQKVKEQFAQKAKEAGSSENVVELTYSNKDSDPTE